MRERASRLRDLGPVLRVQSEEWATATSDAFRNERSPAGEPWPDLAPSTVEQRIAKLPGANRRSKRTGKLTRGSQKKRAKAYEAYDGGQRSGLIKSLVDTGQMRNSIDYRVGPGGNSVEIQAVGYLAPHVTGPEPPKRNPLVIEPDETGPGLHLAEPFNTRLRDAILAYVEDGRT